MTKRKFFESASNSRYGKPARKTRGIQAPSWAEETLALQLKLEKIPQPIREWTFHPTRKWRFDFAWPDYQIAIEVEGGMHKIGRHQRAPGFQSDCEKYNEAAVLGWIVLRYTPAMIQRGVVMNHLLPVLYLKQIEQSEQSQPAKNSKA